MDPFTWQQDDLDEFMVREQSNTTVSLGDAGPFLVALIPFEQSGSEGGEGGLADDFAEAFAAVVRKGAGDVNEDESSELVVLIERVGKGGRGMKIEMRWLRRDPEEGTSLVRLNPPNMCPPPPIKFALHYLADTARAVYMQLHGCALGVYSGLFRRSLIWRWLLNSSR
jgi:hypothetical protein